MSQLEHHNSFPRPTDDFWPDFSLRYRAAAEYIRLLPNDFMEDNGQDPILEEVDSQLARARGRIVKVRLGRSFVGALCLPESELSRYCGHLPSYDDDAIFWGATLAPADLASRRTDWSTGVDLYLQVLPVDMRYRALFSLWTPSEEVHQLDFLPYRRTELN